MEDENIETIYRAKGLKGVMEILCIGGSLARQIGIFLTTP
jgi:hypothetical protein